MLTTESAAGPPLVANAGVGVHGINTAVDVFRLPDLWQLHLYGYSAAFAVDGRWHELRPGTVSLVPPGTTVEFRYRGRSEHLYVHFAMPGRRDPLVGNAFVGDAGSALPVLRELLLDAVAAFPTSPSRSAAAVWAALWRVSDLADADADALTTAPGNPVVAAVVRRIEERLAEPLVVAELARIAGVSHNQLTRLFHEHVGDTVVGYIASRRMARALHLLRASTLSVTAIAAAVGIPDLQAFNKACRRAFGASPRALRLGR
ncbi:helix-turn-helix transcriptional regulator [Catenulispora sp. NL8]|uniref:Helix-turn-helix transcriptional regulator n=1 Tax=Catenulispora pinistramenti TaxID=2705254 RepID=A0ABS5KZT0_9ACTN|nr:AraC family transcriptional regulator [Catenulispora pinistramenti]MBS2551415.1 helix-turn-helix transcriptional regulator [Catenulispora pinistramenti]